MNIKVLKKITVLDQYSISFPGEDTEVIFILLSINIRNGNDVYSGHWVSDVLYYNTETWWSSYDDTITKYSEYLNNLYDNLSMVNEPKKGFFSGWIT